MHPGAGETTPRNKKAYALLPADPESCRADDVIVQKMRVGGEAEDVDTASPDPIDLDASMTFTGS